MPAGWVSAGVAAVDAGESIASNNAAASAAKKNNAAASQLSGAQGSMLTQAEGVAQQPFTPYTGTLTAPMSGNQQLGYNLAANTAATGGAGGAAATAGTNLLGQVAANSDWNSATAAKYMNPYTQDVTNSAIANSNQSYLQSLASQQTGQAGSGAIGGDRAAVGSAALAGQQSLNVGSLTATGNANAYNNAMQAWSTDNNTKIAAANAYESAGQDITKMNSQQISDLMQTGGVSQVIAQTDLNNQYGQFMREQGWSAQQLGSLISAVGTAKGSGTQSAPVQSNTANQLMGLGSTVAGLFGGGSGGTSVDPTISAANDANTDSMISNVPDYTPVLSGSAAPQGAIAYCDYGLKKQLQPIYFDGTSQLPVYTFRYKADDTTLWAGYVAQDVQERYPDAVSRGPKGYLQVNHSKVPGNRAYPMRVLTHDDWTVLDALAKE